MLKGHGGDKTVLIGETMGDRGRFWAEGGDRVLPHSKIDVHYSDGLHDWNNGCEDLNRCHWPVVAFGLKVSSLEPQIRIDPTFEEYASGHDPVLERALSLTK